jgi:hypothetical protein
VILRRSLPLGLLVVLALPVAAGGSDGTAAAANPLCLRMRAADPTAFRQLFPASRGGLGLCSRVQAHRAACVFQTGRDLQSPARFLYQFTCRTPRRQLRAAANSVTQFIVSVKRAITAVQPVTIGSNPPTATTFSCGVRGYATHSSLVCIGGVAPYGKFAVGTLEVNPGMACDVRPLVAIRVANGNWDIFAIPKAPRTLNGPPCPGRHF